MKNAFTAGIYLLLVLASPSPYAGIYGISQSGCTLYENWFAPWSSGEMATIQGDGTSWKSVGAPERVGVYLSGDNSRYANLFEFDNKTTVVKVDPGCSVKLGANHDLGGRILNLPAGVHSLTDYAFNDQVSSAKCHCNYVEWSTFVDFTGSNYYEVEPGMARFSYGNFTIEAWVYLDSYTNWARVMDFSNGPGQDNILLAASKGTSGKPAFHVFVDGTGYAVESQKQIPLQQWTHLAATFGNGHGKLYINGQLVAENAAMASPKSIVREQLYLGKSAWSWDQLLQGRIRNFQFHAKTYDQINIQQHMSYLDKSGFAVLSYSGETTRFGAGLSAPRTLLDTTLFRTDAVEKTQ